MPSNTIPTAAGAAQPSKDSVAGQPQNPGVAAPAGQGTMVTLQQAMDRVYKLYNAGRLEQAERICAQIVQNRPRMADAQNLYGVILHAQGNTGEAVKYVRRAVKLQPQIAQYYTNLGEMQRQRGKVDEALVVLKDAVRIDPKSYFGWNNLGIVHYDKRDFEEAVKCYEEALRLHKAYPEAHNNMGNALRSLGREDDAIEHYQKALLYRENYAEAYNNLAAVLRDKEEIPEAEFAYRKAITLKPNYLEAHNNLAALLVQDDRSDEALRVLGDALKIDAKHVPTLVQVARTQTAKGNYTQAEQACRLAFAEKPDSAEAHSVLGQVHLEVDRFHEAIEEFEVALKIDPNLIEAQNHYGVCLKSVGRLEEARDAFIKNLELNPRSYGVYANLADLEKFTPDHERLKTMESILAEAEDPNGPRYMSLHFALGKAYDDIGEYDKAFKHISIGAGLKRAKLDYDEAETDSFFASIKEIFNAEMFANRPFAGDPTRRPVFIVGMPRSGSTLIEQVLSSHPDVFGAGEIKALSQMLGVVRSRFPGLPRYPKMMSKLNEDQIKLITDGYLAKCGAYAGDAARVTDKLLSNYYFAGMLNILYPNAKIIHSKRNPVDTCLSAYTKLFKDDMPHSYDLTELGGYYKKYEGLMAHWEQVLPPGVLKTCVYEELVDDLESVARELVEFVGLPWNDACLSFHESARPVKTASVVQVRRPVYKTSVERWRRYGSALRPLLDALEYKDDAKPKAKAKAKAKA